MISRVQVSQWSGPAFMLGSLLFIANKLNEMSRVFLSQPMRDVISGQDTLLIVIGQVALIAGLIGFLMVYTGRMGRYGRIALWVFCGGGILLAVGHVAFIARLPEDFFILVIIGVALMVFGLIAFGVIALRRPITGRWRWVPLVTGLLGAVGFFGFSGEEITAPFLILRTLFGIGLVMMGLMLWLERSGETAVAAARA